MATATKTPYHKELQEQLKQVNDQVDINNIENDLLRSDLTDIEKPSKMLWQLTQFILEMIVELNEYEQKKELNDRMKASKVRLSNMLEITGELSNIGDKCRSLKIFNKELFAILQLLRIENSKLRKTNEAMEKSFEGL